MEASSTCDFVVFRYPSWTSANPPLPGAHVSELGELLRSTRQKRNLSLLDVADATRIKVKFLEALEQGDYHLLPGTAYTTGFLRNYAGYLGLHPDDAIAEYYSSRPSPEPTVKAATRVLASGHERHNRKRLGWALGVVVMLFVAAYTVKQYNDTYAHPAPQVNITPANLGASLPHSIAHPVARVFKVRLVATGPVWVRVTADGRRVFDGIMRARRPIHAWSVHRSIYVFTYNGPRIRVLYNGRNMGVMSHRPGAVAAIATASGWQNVS
ncbi:MAG: hypothetical protein NVSMB52_19480 [Chloroflexota bacterium]